MRYVWDNDLHIHSNISLCANDPLQTPERILQYAKDNGLKTIVLTDHYWDENVQHDGLFSFYRKQNMEHINKAKPLPKSEGIEFLFGAETDITYDMVLGIDKKTFDEFDFVVIPTTHLHMGPMNITPEDAATAEGRAKVWISRLEGLLNMDLPFKKIGIAHLACSLIAPTREMYLEVLKLLPKEKLCELFKKCAEVGVGIEINYSDMKFSDDEADIVLRVFRIAKAQGCKFYMGSDAHTVGSFAKCKDYFERAIDMLGLTEDDKFHIAKY
jgi:histidinol phosphatase-like PHP family hydrolase